MDRPQHRSDFEIAIICALPKEAEPVDALFTDTWEGYGKVLGDANIYTTGRIGQQSVVLAHMPGMGKGRAAAVATALRNSFTGIKIALVVGICGVVPAYSGKEIVLGDVVISDAVVQYDLGKEYPNRFERKNTIKDNLPRLGQELTALLNKLCMPRHLKALEKRTLQVLNDIQHAHDQETKFDYPGRDRDKLFATSYRHKHYIPLENGEECDICHRCQNDDDPICQEAEGSTCEKIGCNESTQDRVRFGGNFYTPAIHIGTIASGDKVVKHGNFRDQIARKESVIAFEMEGAGVWDNLTCIVIKAACDYADCHKSDEFQNYAAATAAACAKAFLEQWSDAVATDPPAPANTKKVASKEEECLNLLQRSTSDYQYDMDLTSDREESTCEWILRTNDFENWQKERRSSVLWISGSPGYGKSHLASYLVEELSIRYSRVYYFFFKKDSDHKLATSSLCAILHQLLQDNISLMKHVLHYYEESVDFVNKSTVLWRILTTCVADPDCGTIICILDALDNCEQASGKELAKYLQVFWRSCTKKTKDAVKLKFIITSRAEKWILTPFQEFPRLELENEMENINADISRVMKCRLPAVSKELEKKIMKKTDGTFLWLGIVLEMVREKDCNTTEELEQLLVTIPSDLNDLYEKILGESKDQKVARIILHMIVAAARPFTLDEMKIAMAIRPGQATVQEVKDSQIFPQKFESYIRNACGVFVRFINSRVYLVHETAREFLLNNDLASSHAEGAWRHSFQSVESNLVLVERCMRYLLLLDFGKRKLPVREKWRSFEVQFDNSMYGFLDYAGRQWADHFREAESDAPQSYLELALQIYANIGSCRFQNCLQLLWTGVLPYERPSGVTPLIMATFNGHSKIVKALLERGSQLNEHDKNGRTPLHWAAKRGHENVVRFLVEERAEMDVKDGYWRTPLHHACDAGHWFVSDYLLNKGANIIGRDRNGWTPLRFAVHGGDIRTIEQLIHKMDEIVTGLYALEDGTNEYRQIESEALLSVLQKGQYYVALGQYKDTGYRNATYEKYTSIIMFLFKRANEKVMDKALFWAVKEADSELAAAMLEAANKEQARVGSVALHYITKFGATKFLDSLRFLCHYDIDIDGRDEEGLTPLHTMLQNFVDDPWERESHLQLEAVQIMVDGGADVNAEDKQKLRTPLDFALLGDNREIPEFLKSRGAITSTEKFPGRFFG